MHLQKITLQGFKSYTTPVTITSLTSFTAITGLNGTGKSNIIDAIIFCLHLDTHTTLRIRKLDDLINTNCNEATVHLEFNTCTITRTITRDGKSKTFINNQVVSGKNVKLLLNNNNIQKNAQNVIMQGNITKILNLSKNNYLVQETANIRVYMQEREEALEMIKRKEDKLLETKKMFRDRAEPYIEKMRNERGLYMEMKRCEEQKHANTQIVKNNEMVLKENENGKRINELKQMLKEYGDKYAVLHELKSIEDRVTSVDYNKVYVLKDKIEKLRREMDVLNIQIGQDDENSSEDKENVKNRKRRKSDVQKIDIEELKNEIDALKEKEAILRKEIRNKEAIEAGLNKENVCDKINSIRELRNEKCLAEKKINAINIELPEFTNINEDELKMTNEKYTKKIEELEGLKVDANELSVIKSKCAKLTSSINYPIMEGVYGTVTDNFKIKDSSHQNIIDIILGARKKYVIVDNENIGVQIIKGARQRINVIPLNKIKSTMNQKKEKLMKQNNGINCMNLIEFEPKMRNALEYIFGNYYVFEDSKQAKKMCFKEKVPCISMDGNLYDPRGILTGGTTKKYNEPHTRFSEVYKTLKIFQDLETKYKTFQASAQDYNKAKMFLSKYDVYKQLTTKLKALDNKITVLERILNQSVDLKGEIYNIKKTISRREIVYNNELVKINEKLEQERIKKEKQSEMETLNKRRHALDLEINEVAMQLKRLELENEKLSIYEKDKTICEDKLKLVSVSVAKLKKGINKLLVEIGTNTLEEANSYSMPECYNELDERLVALMPKLQQNVTLLSNETEEALQLELRKAKCDLETLSKKQRRTMNPNNYEFLEKNEEALRFIEQKITELESDKRKLISKVDDLNKQSEVELKNAHQHLNNEAGKYLRVFLPDSDIRLDDDYNIGVKITNWKNSVNELSGGQRSLVALSLIFAMLSYKPAPFYLFDEVDSALDISMTMNIGLCMQKFKASQFIVVSLKEEFYKNASSIYQVHLSEGKTSVKKLK